MVEAVQAKVFYYVDLSLSDAFLVKTRRWTLTPQHRCVCFTTTHHILRPAVTLTFDLQNITRSSVGGGGYSL